MWICCLRLSFMLLFLFRRSWNVFYTQIKQIKELFTILTGKWNPFWLQFNVAIFFTARKLAIGYEMLMELLSYCLNTVIKLSSWLHFGFCFVFTLFLSHTSVDVNQITCNFSHFLIDWCEDRILEPIENHHTTELFLHIFGSGERKNGRILFCTHSDQTKPIEPNSMMNEPVDVQLSAYSIEWTIFTNTWITSLFFSFFKRTHAHIQW